MTGLKEGTSTNDSDSLLTRDKLVCMPLMTDSDNTEGVETEGKVSALEVLGEMGKEFGMTVRNKTVEKLRKQSLLQSFPSEAMVSAYINTNEEIVYDEFEKGESPFHVTFMLDQAIMIPSIAFYQ